MFSGLPVFFSTRFLLPLNELQLNQTKAAELSCWSEAKYRAILSFKGDNLKQLPFRLSFKTLEYTLDSERILSIVFITLFLASQPLTG